MTTFDDDLDSELADLLRQPFVWGKDGERAAPPAAIAELGAVANRLAAEEAAAREVVDDLEQTPPAWWRTTISKSSARNTAGMVRQLIDLAVRLIAKAPLQALEVASIAIDVSNEIGLTDYPGDLVITLRADALREYSYALTFVGRFHEAIAAIDRAEALLAQTPLPDFHLARTKLVRANIYVATDRRPEAIALAHAAGETFLEFGERSRYLNARITEGALLHEHGAIREALAIWQSLKDDPALDEVTRVMVIYDMGLTCREIGDLSQSVELITLAIAEYDLMGMEVDASRARWGLASTLVSAGRMTDAIALFDRAWKELEHYGLDADAALVALELAEVLLAVGRPERVPHICRQLLDRFTAVGMTSRAVTALSFLREVVAIGKAQPPIVRHVREFLRDLPKDGRSFLSLPLPDPER